MSPTWKINICLVSGFYLTAGNHYSVEMLYPINITYLFTCGVCTKHNFIKPNNISPSILYGTLHNKTLN